MTTSDRRSVSASGRCSACWIHCGLHQLGWTGCQHGTYILQPSGIPLQPVASGIISATSVERGLHQTNSKSTSATTASRLPTYLDHIITDQNDGACRCPLLPIPGFSKTSPSLSFSDQYAFRPSGSTTAAIVSLLQTVTSLLQSNPFVVVISLDFSKAFDTVRHSSLLTKMAELDLPAVVYNWVVAFFTGHAHATVYNSEVSSTRSIPASIIQGSSLGPGARFSKNLKIFLSFS